MLKKLFHHASSQKDCARLCCTKIENFGVKAGKGDIFADCAGQNQIPLRNIGKKTSRLTADRDISIFCF